MEHRTTLPNYTLESLANDLGNLRYDALQEFLLHLSNKIAKDADADRERDRQQLAGHLKDASENIGLAWKICKPHMKES